MKRIIVLSTVAALMLGVLAAGAVYANNKDGANKDAGNNKGAGAKCSEATLDGRYLFAFDGFELKDNDKVVPFAQAGYEVYDGNGHVKGVFSGNFNGEITRNGKFSGTYTVKADCTGTVRYTDGTQFDQFLSPDGSQVAFVQVKPPEFVGGSLEVQGTAERVGD
jgi:hypothetical protein